MKGTRVSYNPNQYAITMINFDCKKSWIIVLLNTALSSTIKSSYGNLPVLVVFGAKPSTAPITIQIDQNNQSNSSWDLNFQNKKILTVSKSGGVYLKQSINLSFINLIKTINQVMIHKTKYKNQASRTRSSQT